MLYSDYYYDIVSTNPLVASSDLLKLAIIALDNINKYKNIPCNKMGQNFLSIMANPCIESEKLTSAF